jgi:hypothetical protein
MFLISAAYVIYQYLFLIIRKKILIASVMSSTVQQNDLQKHEVIIMLPISTVH